MGRSVRQARRRGEHTHQQSNQLDQLAQNAAQAGDLRTAERLFKQAIREDKRDISPRYNLAVLLARVDRGDEAAQYLTEILRLRPDDEQAARRLATLLKEARINDPSDLDARGLRAALNMRTVDRQTIAVAALSHLRHSNPLSSVLRRAESEGYPDTARSLVRDRTAKILSNELLLAALRLGVNRDITIEHLLTNVRRVIALELSDERFSDQALQQFICALIQHCLNNEYVVVRDDDEIAFSSKTIIDAEAISAGDEDSCRNLLKLSLYKPFEVTLSDIENPEVLAAIRPKVLRQLAQSRLEAILQERSAGSNIRCLGQINNQISKRVAQQYEAAPYPRWTNVQFPPPGSGLRDITKFITPEARAFMATPFKVLIAGAGTGRHAILSAIRYGPNARLLAVDLSRNSLAYGCRAAKSLGIETIEFLQADLLELGELDQTFDVIEAVGVLHHLQEPWVGLSSLKRRLRPGGIVYLGLYSSISRRSIRELRDAPNYPGPGCSDDLARRYRQLLIQRNPQIPGGHLVRSIDFHTLNSFRDLVLHEQETAMTLPEISEQLEIQDLTFKGFAVAREFALLFKRTFPNDPWPGRLENWWALEQDNPGIFNGMYQFWCEDHREST